MENSLENSFSDSESLPQGISGLVVEYASIFVLVLLTGWF